MNSLYVPLSLEILTLFAVVGGKTILLTPGQEIDSLSHLQQGIHKLLINQPML